MVMNLSPQGFNGLEALQSEMKALKEKHRKELEEQKARFKAKAEKEKVLSRWPLTLLPLLGLILAVCLHFYAMPETFGHRLAVALIDAVLIGGLSWLALVLDVKMKATK